MNVLIVDDSRAMRAYLRGVIQDAFTCTAVEAQSGFEALRLLPREQFDLIITDINMPIMDGLKLIKKVRSEGEHVDVPIIVVTTEKADQKRAYNLGVNKFLTKPVSAPEVFSTAKKLLGIKD